MINYEFETSLADRDSMLVWADYAVNAVFYSGVSEDLFMAMKQRIAREHESALQTNAYWLRALQHKALGIDIIGGFDHIYAALTQESLHNYLQSLRPHTRLRIVMN